VLLYTLCRRSGLEPSAEVMRFNVGEQRSKLAHVTVQSGGANLLALLQQEHSSEQVSQGSWPCYRST
jgi:hypothetical protein